MTKTHEIAVPLKYGINLRDPERALRIARFRTAYPSHTNNSATLALIDAGLSVMETTYEITTPRAEVRPYKTLLTKK
jgi:hypothetical protein